MTVTHDQAQPTARFRERGARWLGTGLRWMGLLTLCGGIGACDRSPNTLIAQGAAAAGKTIGLVLSEYDYLFYETADGREECPAGLVHSSRENWEAQFPTQAARKAHFDRCGQMDHRGPNCESIWAAPDLVKDPLPYREVQGAKAYGVNLDGTEDGSATATTCAHRKFVSPDGQKGIDNQYYRLLGCVRGMRGSAVAVSNVRKSVGSLNQRILLEIKNIDDERNDDDVEVAVYHGKDPLVVDAEDNAVPWQSQRIDEAVPPYRLRGRISNGELITEPADVSWRGGFFGPTLLRGMRLNLRLTSTGAEGLRTGYVDVDQLWFTRRSAWVGFSGDSGPSSYAAMHQLADGYKDTQTGACTALSSATKLKFARIYLRYPSGGKRQ